MSINNIRAVRKDGESRELEKFVYNGVDCDKVYVKTARDNIEILVFDKTGGTTELMRAKISAGNWKMNPITVNEAVHFVDRIREIGHSVTEDRKCVIFPPMCFLDAVIKAAQGTRIEVGAQLISSEQEGNYTGQCSAIQVAGLGAQWVMVGNSEVRQHLYNDNQRFKKEIECALRAGLKVIFCVGETYEQRRAGNSESVIQNHLDEVLGDLSRRDMENIVIVYDPIGERNQIPEFDSSEARKACAIIRSWIERNFGTDTAENVSVCFGGLIPDGSIHNRPLSGFNVDGVLVGEAALREEFCEITDDVFNF